MVAQTHLNVTLHVHCLSLMTTFISLHIKNCLIMGVSHQLTYKLSWNFCSFKSKWNYISYCWFNSHLYCFTILLTMLLPFVMFCRQAWKAHKYCSYACLDRQYVCGGNVLVLYHDSGSLSSSCHHGDPSAIPRHSFWDLWWTHRHWGRLFLK